VPASLRSENCSPSARNAVRVPFGISVRLRRNPHHSPNAVTGDIGHYIMTQCFAFPALGQLGNMGRNTFRMPVFRDLDFSVFKNQNLWGEKGSVPDRDV
jgi:hypothetical protein